MYVPQILSGSTNGRNVKVVQTVTLGTAIHTAVNVTGQFDELTLWACNHHTADVDLTIEWGGATSVDDLIKKTIPRLQGMVPIVGGLRLRAGLAITAFAGTANVIVINGVVNRWIGS